jgi:hypothetical protein
MATNDMAAICRLQGNRERVADGLALVSDAPGSGNYFCGGRGSFM